MDFGWIGNLKKGDKIIIVNDGRQERVDTIDRVTPSGRIVIGGQIFNVDGTERGAGTWHWSNIREWTVEKEAAIDGQRRKGELMKNITHADLRWLTVEECETIMGMIEKSHERIPGVKT